MIARTLGVIPARGGSKGLAGKNILDLNGKPLIAWTIEQALASYRIDKLIVSTDSEEIADVARRWGAEVPFMRPASLAEDTTPSIEVVRHAVELCALDGEQYDFVALLEPTSPLREKGDIDNMVERLESLSDCYDSIVSVGQVGDHPSIMKRLVGQGIKPFCAELSTTTRRQDNEPAYYPYGVAYIGKVGVMLDEGAFYTKRCAHYLIKRYQCFEVDDLYDLLCIGAVMRYEWRL